MGKYSEIGFIQVKGVELAEVDIDHRARSAALVGVARCYNNKY